MNELPIPPRSSLLNWKNHDHNTTNTYGNALKGGKKKGISVLEEWHGSVYPCSLIVSQYPREAAAEASYPEPLTGIGKKKFQEKPVSPSQRTRKIVPTRTENLFDNTWSIHVKNQQEKHPLPPPCGFGGAWQWAALSVSLLLLCRSWWQCLGSPTHGVRGQIGIWSSISGLAEAGSALIPQPS